ncbi:hypothetical protein BN7_6576 [Wickerhamomyces ciferrii]|uniref:Arrestin-like N-terminal domain-containing protein n=1 Tax=Wickerhamomyces ciferrii (strain ATCC 14091 / BCRC 22168 / CBS 111 / JCM 3599 / NBRC 0793 / NRRL Y-1031 F-60-10) TaxID=1206466 RepID=K0L031_WICCF|nr:uncharacterized protein BN7_6576 [Wickerhamomyces ciferrii]CCH46969.1 hypothetical protein BN7_6576 [Wickerhamomyces ciferrii]
MVSACEVKIEAQELRPSNIFTSLDTIRGKVYVNVRSEISLSCIQIKLEGISQSIIREKHLVKRKEKEIAKLESHRLLYETRTIFPPKNVRQVSSAKEFTLTPGEYEYDFEFKLPLESSCGSNNAPTNGITNKFQVVRRNSDQLNSNNSAHFRGPLPPSLSDLGELGQINYFLKVTVKRTSIIKPNIRKFSPFRFIPFDSLEHLNSSSRELNFIRKEQVFKDKIPEIIAIIDKPQRPYSGQGYQTPPSPQRRSSSFLKTLFFGSSDDISQSSTSIPQPPPTPPKNEPPTITAYDVPFFFEARFNGLFQTVGKSPTYKLYVLSKANPKKYIGMNGESSGLGAVYLKNLKIELFIVTNVVSQEFKRQDYKVITLCQLSVSGKLDLAYARKSKAINEQTGSALHELEIPTSLYSNAVIPYSLVPNFKTCNMERKYKLKITAGFAETKDSKKIKEVSIDTWIDLIGGIPPPMASESIPARANLPTYADATGYR